MGFSEKIKLYFKEKDLNNRQIAKIMDNYSESMISQFMNSDKISKTFIKKLTKYFPDIDINYMIRDDDQVDSVNESRAVYKTRSLALLEEIREKFEELEKIVSQN